MTTRTLSILALLLPALAACEPAAEAPAPAPEAPADPAPVAQWELVASGEGVGLFLLGPGGRPQLALSCLEGGVLRAVAPGFTVIGSEERFTLGVGDEAFTLVAQVVDAPPGGVTAEGPADPGLLRRLEAGGEVSALYGTQQVGPTPGPDSETARAFAEGCRA